MSLSDVSRCPDVRGTTHLQQLWRHCSCWTSVVELTTSPAAQSRHQIRTVQTTAEGSSLRERWTRRSVTFDMQRHRKTFYLLIYYSVDKCIKSIIKRKTRCKWNKPALKLRYMRQCTQCVYVQLWNLDFEANTGKQITGIWNVLFEADCWSNSQRQDQE